MTTRTGLRPLDRRRFITAISIAVLLGALVLAGTYVLSRSHRSTLSSAAAPAPSVTSLAASMPPSVTPSADSGASRSKYVGVWTVHGGNLTIGADLVGVWMYNYGPCDDGTADMCTGSETVPFLAIGQRLEGRIESSVVKNPAGKLLTHPVDGGTTRVGVKVVLEFIDDDVLRRTYDPPQGGNPYLCGVHPADRLANECG